MWGGGVASTCLPISSTLPTLSSRSSVHLVDALWLTSSGSKVHPKGGVAGSGSDVAIVAPSTDSDSEGEADTDTDLSHLAQSGE